MLDLKALLTKILQSLKSPIVYREYTSTGGTTQGSHGATYFTITVPEISGYKMLCVPYSRTNGNVWLSYPVNSGNGSLSGDVVVWVRNTTTGSASVSTVTIGVLYIRSDLY